MNAISNVPLKEYSRDQALRQSGQALKAARLMKGLSRKQAAGLCGCSHQSFEQIENARTGFTEARLQSLVKALGYQWNEFLTIRQDSNLALRSAMDVLPKKLSRNRPRRNTFKIITKEVRVLKVLRQRKGISQCEASALCGYVKCAFGQIEHGRIELPHERIAHILNCLGFSFSDFDFLMNSERLKDEILAECSKALKQLDEHNLVSVQMIIQSLQRK